MADSRVSSSLDDAFACFLNEIGEDAENSSLEAPAKKANAGTTSPESYPKKRPRLETRAARACTAESLRKAAFCGDVSLVQDLLSGLSAVERLLLIDNQDAEDGFSALHLAVMQGHLQVIEGLLRGRADVDCQSQLGDTPLLWAAHSGSDSAAKLLLDAGADVSLKNRQGRTAQKQARIQGHQRLADLLETCKGSKDGIPVSLKRWAHSGDTEAAARRAANLAAVQAALQAQREQEEEEAFWAGVRARREEREAREGLAGVKETGAESQEEALDIDPSLPAQLQAAYRMLSLSSRATEKDIRKAYRTLALRHHPDKNPSDPHGAKARFTEVALAYETICEHVSDVPQGAEVAPPSESPPRPPSARVDAEAAKRFVRHHTSSRS